MSLVDEEFVYNVRTDIKSYLQKTHTNNRVLVFPPVNNYRRFLIHRTCEEFSLTHNLVTFSVGSGIERRTVVCHKEQLHIPLEALSSSDKKEERNRNWRSSESKFETKKYSSRMGVERNSENHAATSHQRSTIEKYCPPALRKAKESNDSEINRHQSHKKTTSSAQTTTTTAASTNIQLEKIGECATTQNSSTTTTSNTNSTNISAAGRPARRERRPDREVYVPRARRSQTAIPNQTNTNIPSVGGTASSSSSLNNRCALDEKLYSQSDNQKRVRDPNHLNQSREHLQHTNTEQLHSKSCPRNVIDEDKRHLANNATTPKTNSSNNIVSASVEPVISTKSSSKINNNNCDNIQINDKLTNNHTDDIVVLQNQKQTITKNHNKTFNSELTKNCDNLDVIHNSVNSTKLNSRNNHQQNNQHLQHINNMNKSNKTRASSDQQQQHQRGNLLTRIEDANGKLNKKVDHEAEELQRASKEINRSNRRIIKQTFKSDILEIPEPSVKNILSDGETEPIHNNKPARVVDPENDDWDSMFDDNGECLDPKLIEELTATVGKVHIETPKTDYTAYLMKQDLLSEEEFPHVLEISNFPVEFKTQDLMMIFSTYKETGFDIKWVDDTHALAVFSSSKIAAEVLAKNHSFVVLKPLAEATFESRAKAKKCSNSLQPYRPRPETCAALARRLVTGALGVRLKTAAQERENEKRVLKEAKERKLLAAKQRDEVWES